MSVAYRYENTDLVPDDGSVRVVLSLWRGLIAVPKDAYLWPISKREIAQQVAQRHGLTLADLLGRGGSRRVAHARQEAMYLMHKTGRFSTPQIGEFLGGRDHSTVVYGIHQVAKRLREQQA